MTNLDILDKVYGLITRETDDELLFTTSTLDDVDTFRQFTELLDQLKYSLNNPASEAVEQMVTEDTLAHQPVTAGWTPTHRHVKRGSEYRVISEMAQIQASKDDPLTDYELAVIYQGKDGQYWVRRRSEFNDGRFAALKSEGL